MGKKSKRIASDGGKLAWQAGLIVKQYRDWNPRPVYIFGSSSVEKIGDAFFSVSNYSKVPGD